MKSSLIAPLLVLLLGPHTMAQDHSKTFDPVPATEKPYTFEAARKVRIFCLAADTGISSLWVRTFQGAEGTITPVSFSVPFSKRSESIAYRGPAKIEFFDQEPPPGPPFNDKGERQGPSPVAIASLPPGKSEVLLLFVPLPKDDHKGMPKYRVIPFDDSKDMLPWGGYRLVNFTSRTLTAFAGSRDMRFEIKANNPSGTIEPGGEKRNLLWLFYDHEKGTEKPVFSAQWLHRPDYRSLIFITDSRSQRGAISVKSIDEWKN